MRILRLVGSDQRLRQEDEVHEPAREGWTAELQRDEISEDLSLPPDPRVHTFGRDFVQSRLQRRLQLGAEKQVRLQIVPNFMLKGNEFPQVPEMIPWKLDNRNGKSGVP
jgi:hypothetical protein